jgi:hypothetical protein
LVSSEPDDCPTRAQLAPDELNWNALRETWLVQRLCGGQHATPEPADGPQQAAPAQVEIAAE